jgi:hypothetical protein
MQDRQDLRFRSLWLALGIGFVLAVAHLSLMHDPPDFGHGESGFKLDHATAYGCLMLWFAQLFPAWRERWLCAIALCGLGITLEYLQGLTDYRGFEYADMLINAAGIATGLLMALTPLQRILHTLEAFIPETSRHHP